MESSSHRSEVDRNPQRELDAVRRSAERPHLEYPSTPVWFWFAFGAAAAAYTWSFSLDQAGLSLLVLAASLAACWWMIAHITRLRGVFPSFSTMPQPLKRETFRAWLQVALLVPVVIVLWRTLGSTLASILAGLSCGAIMFAHQRRYDALAADLRVDADRQPQ